MDDATQRALRALPSVEEILGHPGGSAVMAGHPRAQVVEAVRTAIQAARREIMSVAGTAGAVGVADTRAGVAPLSPAPTGPGVDVSLEAILARTGALLDLWDRPGLRPVMNLTGVVVHTNLGRSRLAEKAIERMAEVARSYSNLEYDLERGARGNREVHVEALLRRLTGAEAAFAVNNNAGAVLLMLMALAGGREVLVSRGQLVEIGGSFRLPDIIRAGGVRLVEVGTTNRTRIEDYEAAITPETALLMRVHTSNYRIVGFTEEAELDEMAELGRRRGLIVADDLGSGALHDVEAFQGEPTVAASLRTGADVVCFSGDKLLGGPQAGILVGKAAVIDRLRGHPVARTLRLDKMTLAALEATLEIYQDPEKAPVEIPTLRYLHRRPEETADLAAALQSAIEKRCGDGFILEVEASSARAGGGTMPLVELPSHAVRIRFPETPLPGGIPGGTALPAGAAGGPGGSPAAEPRGARIVTPKVTALDMELRRAPVPVVARVSQDSLHLDVMALEEREVEAVAESVAWAVERLVGRSGPGAGEGAAPGG